MGRNTKIVAYGLGGIALALAMSLGAFALAGSTLSHPTSAIRIVGVTQTQPHPSAEAWVPSWSPDPHPGSPAGSEHATSTPTTASPPTASASPDDHGGGDDNSGPGSGDDDHDDD